MERDNLLLLFFEDSVLGQRLCSGEAYGWAKERLKTRVGLVHKGAYLKNTRFNLNNTFHCRIWAKGCGQGQISEFASPPLGGKKGKEA